MFLNYNKIASIPVRECRETPETSVLGHPQPICDLFQNAHLIRSVDTKGQIKAENKGHNTRGDTVRIFEKFAHGDTNELKSRRKLCVHHRLLSPSVWRLRTTCAEPRFRRGGGRIGDDILTRARSSDYPIFLRGKCVEWEHARSADGEDKGSLLLFSELSFVSFFLLIVTAN